MKVWDQTRIELMMPGSAVRLATGTGKQTFQLIHLLVDNAAIIGSLNKHQKSSQLQLQCGGLRVNHLLCMLGNFL